MVSVEDREVSGDYVESCRAPFEAGHRFLDEFGAQLAKNHSGVLPARRSSLFHATVERAFKEALRHPAAVEGWTPLRAFELLPSPSLAVRYLDLALQHSSQTLTFSVWLHEARFSELAADGIVKGIEAALSAAFHGELGKEPDFWFAVCTGVSDMATNPMVNGAVAAPPEDQHRIVNALRTLNAGMRTTGGYLEGLRVGEPHDLSSWGRCASATVDFSRHDCDEDVVGCSFPLSNDAVFYFYNLLAIADGNRPPV